jgi:hypothetical protein
MIELPLAGGEKDVCLLLDILYSGPFRLLKPPSLAKPLILIGARVAISDLSRFPAHLCLTVSRAADRVTRIFDSFVSLSEPLRRSYILSRHTDTTRHHGRKSRTLSV